MKIVRIPYVNCYPVYGAIDRGVVALEAELLDGVPTDLNRRMAAGELDISVVSAVEYARDADRYLLLPDLAISCDGPVRSVMLFSRYPASELTSRRVLVSRSSMTSVALLELLFRHVWKVAPAFAQARAEPADLDALATLPHEAVLVIGDAALALNARGAYAHRYDLGAEWKQWTGLPFVFAVWAAQRSADPDAVHRCHDALIASRAWGLQHLDLLAEDAFQATGVAARACRAYLRGLDYALTPEHLAGLTEFFHRVAVLQFLQVA